MILSRVMPDNSPHIVSNGYYQHYFEYIRNNKKYIIDKRRVDPDFIRHTFSKYHLKQKFKIEDIRYNIHYIQDNVTGKTVLKPISTTYYHCQTQVRTGSTNTGLDIDDSKLKMDVHIVRYRSVINSHDVGRVWLKSIGIKKWEKICTNVKTY